MCVSRGRDSARVSFCWHALKVELCENDDVSRTLFSHCCEGGHYRLFIYFILFFILNLLILASNREWAWVEVGVG